MNGAASILTTAIQSLIAHAPHTGSLYLPSNMIATPVGPYFLNEKMKFPSPDVDSPIVFQWVLLIPNISKSTLFTSFLTTADSPIFFVSILLFFYDKPAQMDILSTPIALKGPQNLVPPKFIALYRSFL